MSFPFQEVEMSDWDEIQKELARLGLVEKVQVEELLKDRLVKVTGEGLEVRTNPVVLLTLLAKLQPGVEVGFLRAALNLAVM